MRKTIIASLLLASSTLGHAQERNDTTNTPFLFKSFVNGTVLMKDGRREPAPLNYSPFKDQMFFLKGKDTLALYELDIIDTVYIGNAKFVPAEKLFYEVVTSSKVPIYIEYVARVLPRVAVVNYLGTKRDSYKQADRTISDMTYGKSDRREVYVAIEKHFWLRKSKQLTRADSQREIERTFPDRKDDIRWFVSDKSLNLKNTEDLEKLIAYCAK